jgi:ribosomal protein S18 acetylase RimI-like enzyme
MRNWSIEETPADKDLAVVSAGVIDFGRAEAAGGNPRPIACFLREGTSIIAGATGRIEFERLFVSYLWVKEELRGTGLGSAALRRIEDAAHERGARDSLIETLNDQTAALYRRCGYAEIAVISPYVGRFTKYVMLKKLERLVAPELDPVPPLER